MFQTFRNAWKIPELKNRLLFTLAILVVYRLGSAIPVPFITGSALNADVLQRQYALVSRYDERRCPVSVHALRVRCDTLYQRFHHCAAAHRCDPRAGKHGEGSRRPAEAAADHPVCRRCHRSGDEPRLLLRDPQYGRTEVHQRRGRYLYRRCHHCHLYRRCAADHLVRRADR